ncbi:LPXTG cell wall anchor domain-containing protein, partial [Boudabousia marimammalium]
NPIDTVTITVVEKPVAPNWEDVTGKPGDDVVVPNAGGDVPDGATVESTGPGTVVLDKDGNITVTINEDAKPGDKVVVTVKDKDGNPIDTVTITVVEKPDVPTVGDKDGDGVPDDKDQCDNTPDGAKVDANGCAVAPTAPTVPSIDGEVGKPIDPITIPIDNPGKATDLVCKAEGLPKGVTIKLNEEGTACVISGTPTEVTRKDQPVKITITYNRPDGDKGAGEPIVKHTTVTIKAVNGATLPKTGVSTNGIAYSVLALLGAGLAFLAVRRKKQA